MKRLTFIGHINAFTGYGRLAEAMLKTLLDAGVHPSVRPVNVSEMLGKIPVWQKELFVSGVQPEPWELLLHPPVFCPTDGKRTARFTMWESTRLQPAGVAMLNKCDFVMVPSAWNATCFSASGVTKPIRIVPLGIDTDVYSYKQVIREADDKDYGKFIFGCAARVRHGGVRKGIDHTIKLFQRAFPKQKDVSLRIKVYHDDPVMKFDDSRIEINSRYLSDHDLAAWFAGLHCFVSCATAEGWGLMQHQSMAVGRPVIGVDYGGVTEFFGRHNGIPVSWKLKPAEGFYKGCGDWAVPDDDSVIEKMRWAHNHPSDCERIGAAAYESVSHLTWKNHGEKLISTLKEFGVV